MAGQRVISAVLTLRDRNFGSTVRSATSGTRDLERRVRSTGNTVRAFGKSATDSFKGAALGIAGMAAAYVGISAIKDFGVGMLESAANAQATAAQFTQVFGEVESGAQSTVDKLGKSFGMVSERIKPAFTTMTSMFKGLGMDTDTAMKQAESAVTLAADAAAFYDKSYEDANSALNSFIKGNYEGGEAIGLFANETQLASWASKNLGVDWKKLDEAGKQVARLGFAESMQKAAGATGQAARESDSYQNQLGNLSANWDKLKAKLGEKVLDPAIQGIKTLSNWVSNVDTTSIISGFSVVGSTLVNMYASAKPGIDWIKDTGLPAMRDGIGFVVDKATEMYNFITGNWGSIGPVVAGVVAGIATLKLGILAVSVATKAWAIGTTAVQLATALLNGTLAVSPLGWVAIAIGAVVAAGVLLYQNWDTVKEAAQGLWEKLKIVWTAVQTGFSVAWGMVKSAAGDALNFIIEKVNGVIGLMNKIPGVDIKAIGTVDWGKGGTPQYATGTSYAPGGLARINEGGRGEIVDLPNGSRVYPHDKSVQMARSEGSGVVIQNINIQGTNLSVQQIASELVAEVKLALGNM